VAEAVYALCALTSIACTVLLLRGYRQSKTRLLFWASLCFVGFALNNVLLFIDLILLPQIDLFWWRTLPALIGVGLFVYGLIWEAE
jgi:drug/metabolite transporter (DMT)-like permease